MTKLMSVLLLCLFFSSCNPATPPECEQATTASVAEGSAKPSCTLTSPPEATPPVTSTPEPPQAPPVTSTTGLPTAALTFETDVSFYNTSAAQEAKFYKALEIIKDVLATEEFRSRILNHTYDGKKTFVDNGGFSNSQIYQKILDGAEKLQPAKNNEMNMEVELYYTNNSTVGYTYPNSKRVWVNTKFFNTYTATSVAANLFHEWLHKVGFGHASSYSVSRDSSVPYAIGRMVGDIGKRFL